jgi:uncharacterized protein
MIEKCFISAEELLRDSFLLGRRILQSGFNPNFIVGIWRGGTPVGIAVQEYLDFHGIKTDHISIRTSSYEDIDKRAESIQVHGLNYIVRKINADDRLLIVDDVFDSGLSIEAVINTLANQTRRNTPGQIRVATVYFKPARNKTARTPEYYIHETDKWLVFPHELNGLTLEEIRASKPGAYEMLDKR